MPWVCEYRCPCIYVCHPVCANSGWFVCRIVVCENGRLQPQPLWYAKNVAVVIPPEGRIEGSP